MEKTPKRPRLNKEGEYSPFELELWFAKYEFTTNHMVSGSDCQTMKIMDLLDIVRQTQDPGNRECLNLWENLDGGYTESLGHPALLGEIRSKYKRFGVAKPLHILEVVPAEGLLLASMAMLQAGDTVICQAPAYQSLYEHASARGCTVIPWNVRLQEKTSDGAFWDWSLEELKSLIEVHGANNSLRMVVLNSPHNPTGAVLSLKDMQNISKWCEEVQAQREVVLFVDEMYSDLLDDPLTAAGLPNSIILNGVSKPHGFPGLRVGWLSAANEVHFDMLAAQKLYTTICPPGPSEILALMVLRNEKQILKRNRDFMDDNLKLLQQFLRRNQWIFTGGDNLQPGGVFCIARAATAFIRVRKEVLRRFAVADASALSPLRQFCKILAERFSVLTLPGDTYPDYDENKVSCGGGEHVGGPCLRFGLGRSNFADAIQATEAALAILKSEMEVSAS